MSNKFRPYQVEADNAISEELLLFAKCLIKMFCGTGKSLLMRYCKINQDKALVAYVFPSLALIQQFNKYYLHDFPIENVLAISSENGATTNPADIQHFLSRQNNKVICVTYNSFHVLKDNLCVNQKINVCNFDEAHHVVGTEYQKLIFENDVCEKQIFYTATPKNANGVIMYDREHPDRGMCGRLAYEYSYLKGLNEGCLNPIEIRMDMFTENTNRSIYECIARAILSSGNNRVLTFHADVNTERDTSVNNFVNDREFKIVFKVIQKKEFPNITKYKKVKMVGLSSDLNGNKRNKILKAFDDTNDNEIMVISSCRTVGEGIDTKNANMVVFVDPKTSYVDIIQNIGRIVRKVLGQNKPNSTILIPCWVDKKKYLECNGDKEKCDEVIRQDMSETGNFNSILNVLSALKQEDEDIYDICLHYPDTYSPQEIYSNLEKHGYTVDEQVGDGELVETLEHLLDAEIDYDAFEDCEDKEEMITRIAEDNKVCIEVFTNSLEKPIERYNSKSDECIRLYKEDTEAELYCPITQKNTKSKRNTGCIVGPKKESRVNIKIHVNPDIKILWNIVGDIDITKDICSCIIDCEIVEYDPMEVAQSIVERANERVRNGLHLLPRNITNIKNRTTAELEQENKDASKIGHWKNALNGKGTQKCPNEVRDYLDKKLLNWRIEQDFDKKAMEDAQGIVERATERVNNGLHLLPRNITNIKNRCTPELEQENKDAKKIGHWKNALNGKGTQNCPNEVRDYLDKKLLNWRLDFDKKAMEDAQSIVERANVRVIKKLHLLPRALAKENQTTAELEQEDKDARKLGAWKTALKGKGRSKCPDEVRYYLDQTLLNWRLELDFDKKAMKDAQRIVERANERVKHNLHLLPRKLAKEKWTTPDELVQEGKDAQKLGNWKMALNGKGSSKCSNEVRDYLDQKLLNWRLELDKKAMEQAKTIVERANERVRNNLHLLPRAIRKKNQTTAELEQEGKDTQKLGLWKMALNGKGSSKCSNEVRDYLDQKLPNWRMPEKKSMELKQPSVKETETPSRKRKQTKSEISILHQRYKSMTSQRLNKEFQENPDRLTTYHAISEENEKSFPEHDIPRNRIIQELNKIQTRRTKLVVDMGCGKAQISQHYRTDKRFKFINYDHISLNDTVVPCDISHTPLEYASVEICILSLAMWGSNCREYIAESNRILESNGKLYIIEPTKRWSEQDEKGNIVAGKEGVKLKSLLEDNKFQIVEQSIAKFCMFICIKV